ncbi:MAG: endonuclease MutS2 [Chloroflexi bacterium HGW-Chloroflexi-8]|nr:MAG: endonuclease MutS2 [Chloroflexi bacterium HGW-Chloroflexi-8]
MVNSKSIMDQKTLFTLEFDKVLEKLAGYAAFSASADLARNLRPSNNRTEARERQALSTEARLLLSMFADTTVGGSRDIRPLVNRAAQHGILEPADLLSIKFTLAAARDLSRSLAEQTGTMPLLVQLGSQLPPPPGIIEAITRTISERGEVLDNASPKLASLRSEIRVAHDRLMTRLQQMISDPHKSTMLQEAIITQRNGRYVIPLRAEFKGRIKAIIHDQSSSGATLFVEPLVTVELNNRWHELQLSERDEIRRILLELTDLVGNEADRIREIVFNLARFDLALMFAKYAEDLDANEPELLDFQNRVDHHPGCVIRLRDARHPLLDQKSVVPIDVELDENTFGVVITGPNTGGKTVSLKTVGLMVLMAQSGMHIPAQSGSSLSVFQDVYADIGDEQSIEQSLSTFSGHITNITRILKHANERSLVLFDELGSGTDPQEGSALARALLSYLVRNKITSLVATHYPELKAYAHNTPGIINASMEFNLQSLKPTYHLMVGLPGRSNALAISERLGLPLEIVEDARSLVDPSELRAEDLLNEIHRQRGIARKERRNAEKSRIQARRAERELNERLAKVEQERLTILENARKEAEEQTRQLSAEMESIRKELSRAHLSLETIKAVAEKVEIMEADVSVPVIPRSQKARGARKPLEVGEKIVVRTLGMKGVISAIGEDDAEAQLGNLRVRVSFDDILRAGDTDGITEDNEMESSKVNPRVRKVLAKMDESSPKTTILHASPGMELDIRGEISEDGIDKMERFIESAYLSGMPFVRIIHGKGTGRLRQVIRESLSKSSFVERWESGTDREGGEGVTVAFMRND